MGRSLTRTRTCRRWTSGRSPTTASGSRRTCSTFSGTSLRRAANPSRTVRSTRARCTPCRPPPCLSRPRPGLVPAHGRLPRRRRAPSAAGNGGGKWEDRMNGGSRQTLTPGALIAAHRRPDAPQPRARLRPLHAGGRPGGPRRLQGGHGRHAARRPGPNPAALRGAQPTRPQPWFFSFLGAISRPFLAAFSGRRPALSGFPPPRAWQSSAGEAQARK